MRHSSKTTTGKGHARKRKKGAVPFSARQAADVDERTPFAILAYEIIRPADRADTCAPAIFRIT